MSYRILVTGTRNDLKGNDAALRAVWNRLRTDINMGLIHDDHVTIVHGDCPTGVDSLMNQLPLTWPERLTVERHPADWYTHDDNCYHGPRPGGKCPAAGPRRNALMVGLGADVCLAFPMGKSAGTRGCVKLAEAANIPAIVTEL